MNQGPLILSKLAKTPKAVPTFGVKVKNASGGVDILPDPRATRTLLAFMNQHAVMGGAACHWGGPSAFVEIMSSIHAIMFRQREEQWYDRYNFVNDAGHCENGIYALRVQYDFGGMTFEDIKGFRSIESKLTGHGEAHLNREGVLISNGPLGSAIGQAQGLCLGDKALGNSRITVCTLSDGGSMEGEAKECFAALPGLAAKEKLNPFLLLISDNDTKLSGRISEDAFSMAPTFASLEVLGHKVFREEEGNNLHRVHYIIDKALCELREDSSRPVIIVFKTLKGYGVKSTEESSNGGHGFPLKAYDNKLKPFIQELWQDVPVPEIFQQWVSSLKNCSSKDKKTSSQEAFPTEKVQIGLTKAAVRAAEEGLPVFSLSGDLQGSTGMAPFHRAFPDRFVDLGVAESNMISSGVGMSKLGFIPLVDTFAQFAITKGNLPLIMSALSEAPLIGLFSHAGLQDAADGASHQCTTYIAATASIPHITVVICSCSREAEVYLYKAIQKLSPTRGMDRGGSILFFYGRENHPSCYRDDVSFEWGKPQLLREGRDGVITTCGPLVSQALKAADLLEREGLYATVVNHPFVNNIDVDFFQDILEKNKNRLVTVEDHQIKGGMGSLLITELTRNGIYPRLTMSGIEGKLGRSAYKASHLYALHKIDAQSIFDSFF